MIQFFFFWHANDDFAADPTLVFGEFMGAYHLL